MRDVYPTNSMFRRRRIRTEREKKDAGMETRVKVDGCRAVVSLARLSREQLLLTIPEVSFEVTMTQACSSFFALTYIISFHALLIDIVATAGDFRFWAQFIRKPVKHRVTHSNFNP